MILILLFAFGLCFFAVLIGVALFGGALCAIISALVVAITGKTASKKEVTKTTLVVVGIITSFFAFALAGFHIGSLYVLFYWLSAEIMLLAKKS